MPTYEYRCDGCGHELTIEQRITEPKLTTCPKCSEEKLVRLISGGNFILKGGGWYADLYHKPAGAKSEGGSSSKSESSSSSSSSSSDSSSASSSPSTSSTPSTPSSGSSGQKT
ncbi:MAG: zinc ribbon domain-containing protein [Deltaproteobacteria bacterium]|nr:zinc ribbon domain-containing protein [Deltaproteobacteria bacterium]